MKSSWSDKKAGEFVSRYSAQWGEDLAYRTYSARLLGAEKSLVLHGGGNTSVKSQYTNLLGESLESVFVKASGYDLSVIEPQGHPALDLEYLKRLRELTELSDEAMVREIRTHLLDCESPTPSIETLVHAFIAKKFMDHTHADAILALTNQVDGQRVVNEALGEDVIVLDYVKPGFQLAQATVAAMEAHPGKRAIVWMRHGLLTWGDTAQESYQSTIELVSKAEEYVAQQASNSLSVTVSTPLKKAEQRWVQVAPLLRGLLAEPNEVDQTYRRMILRPLISRATLDFVDSNRGRELALSPPLTSDHLIRTKALPVWIDSPAYDEPSQLRDQIADAIQEYRTSYQKYLDRNRALSETVSTRFDSAPRVILMPGLGAACSGKDVFCRQCLSRHHGSNPRGEGQNRSYGRL